MVTISLFESTPTPFDFEAAVRSHGWSALVPFAWDADGATLSRIQQLQNNKVIRLHLQEKPSNGSSTQIKIDVETVEPLTAGEEIEIRQMVRRMIRLDEDFSEF